MQIPGESQRRWMHSVTVTLNDDDLATVMYLANKHKVRRTDVIRHAVRRLREDEHVKIG